jgi:uncharacterized protein
MYKSLSMFLAIIIPLYTLINYYIGRRGWQVLKSIWPSLTRRLYWPVFWVLTLSYLIARLGEKILPTGLASWLDFIGAIWMGAVFYLLFALIFIDIIRLIDKFLGIIPKKVKEYPSLVPVVGLFTVGIVAGILGYGYWKALHPVIQEYNITIPKKSNLKELHAVMVSDIHLGTIVKKKRLDLMVAKVNELEPDVVFLAGDIIDGDLSPFINEKMAGSFRNLKTKYGVYGILGNHEYIGRATEKTIASYKDGNINVLRDNVVKIDNSIYIVGRDDISSERFSAKGRQPLAQLVKGLDKNLPIILMDHQPIKLEEAVNSGIDLQLSGHTHYGQIFPNQFITDKIYENDWGLLKKGNTNIIVSSGFGTWGPPFRIGTQSEIVNLKIKFVQ